MANKKSKIKKVMRREKEFNFITPEYVAIKKSLRKLRMCW